MLTTGPVGIIGSVVRPPVGLLGPPVGMLGVVVRLQVGMLGPVIDRQWVC